MSQDTSRSLRSHDLLSSSSLLGRLKFRSSPQTSESDPIKIVILKNGPPPPPPYTNLKRKLEMPIDVDAADFSFDSLAPHVDTLLFPSFKDRQSSQTFADLSQEAAVQSFQVWYTPKKKLITMILLDYTFLT
ncbi:uncharacterized protein LOC110686523 [Chenopodium quinoa]|uniref:uncharacterized protein LOC110686523 n=1 Tax=Chenopodium quinoa TaxID=63459 RepID=UPI000B77EF17|nr:uncharacterized protein LOC110686523 [Chenopodium quinoa]